MKLSKYKREELIENSVGNKEYKREELIENSVANKLVKHLELQLISLGRLVETEGNLDIRYYRNTQRAYNAGLKLLRLSYPWYAEKVESSLKRISREYEELTFKLDSRMEAEVR